MQSNLWIGSIFFSLTFYGGADAQVKLPDAAGRQVISAVSATIHSDCAQPQVAKLHDAADDPSQLRNDFRLSERRQSSSRLDETLLVKARNGDAPSAWRAALASFRGDCRESNFSESLTYFQLAAQAGHACAVGAVGLMQGKGWGLVRDFIAAREVLEKSVGLGCKRAHYWMWLIDEAAARPQARFRAREQLELGAAAGDGHALNALGVLLETSNQRSQARKLYEQAVALGHPIAKQNIARLQRYFAQTSDKPSLQTLQSKSAQGDANSQYLLARRLHQGDGAAVNYAQALKLYQQAAQTGHPAAREMLQLLQARLASAGELQNAVWSDLALIELRSDDLLKSRGVVQPIEDTDPFAGLT